MFVSLTNSSLQEGSPCIDKGSSSALPEDISDLDDDGDTEERIPLDLAGNDRKNNGSSPDMGAYEFQGN